MSETAVRYLDTIDGITAAQLTGGFFVGWPNPPNPEAHLRLLAGSDHVVVAIDPVTEMVVGFITAISDGVLSAYIPLLEVLPESQQRGIGRELVRRMLDQLRNLYMVDLLCNPELQPFYGQFGMHPSSGMLLRNYDRQSGNGET